MTLTLAILANVIADIALVGGLAYVMSRPRALSPHLAGIPEPPAKLAHGRRSAAPRTARSSLRPAYAQASD